MFKKKEEQNKRVAETDQVAETEPGWFGLRLKIITHYIFKNSFQMNEKYTLGISIRRMYWCKQYTSAKYKILYYNEYYNHLQWNLI